MNLGDVMAQEHVTKPLLASALRGKFADAYLIGGPYGTGKTSIARVIASLMNCEKHLPNGDCCGVCQACVSIQSGNALDVRELDGGSNSSVDDARNLRDTVIYPPQVFRRKVYIIDEAQELSEKACAALLKTTEEPPPFVSFIFCTTEPRKLIPAIASRSQKFFLNKIPSLKIAERLKSIAEKESIKIDESALMAIARSSNGAMRDAVVALQQLADSCNKNITSGDATAFLGVPEKRLTLSLAKMISEKNISGILTAIAEVYAAGINTQIFLYDLSEVFRSIITMKEQGADSPLLDLTKEERAVIYEIGTKMSMSWLTKIALGAMGRVKKDLDAGINDRLVLETTLINAIMIS